MSTSSRACGCGCGQQTNTDPSGRPRSFVQGHNRRGRGNGWSEQGYWFVRHHGERRALHRVLVEQREGRRLQPNEVVHHIDGNPLNNAPANLMILTRSEHIGLHARAKRRRWTQTERERAVELYEVGMPVEQVAQALRRPYSSTRRVIASAGRTRTPAETRRLCSASVPTEVETALN
jgi:hypothetical protein